MTVNDINRVGKVLRVIADGKDVEGCNLRVKVQWYYAISDVDILQNEQENFGINEVFISNHFQEIDMEFIMNKWEVMSIQEYEQLTPPIPEVYFTRSYYDIFAKTLIPSLSEFQKVWVW